MVGRLLAVPSRRAQIFGGGTLPVVLYAKSLGADISYCFGSAVKTRNSRVRTGGKRLDCETCGPPIDICAQGLCGQEKH